MSRHPVTGAAFQLKKGNPSIIPSTIDSRKIKYSFTDQKRKEAHNREYKTQNSLPSETGQVNLQGSKQSVMSNKRPNDHKTEVKDYFDNKFYIRRSIEQKMNFEKRLKTINNGSAITPKDIDQIDLTQKYLGKKSHMKNHTLYTIDH